MIELALAVIVLLIGVKSLFNVLGVGNINDRIEKAKNQVRKLESVKHQTGLLLTGWLMALGISISLIWLALAYLVKLV